MSKTDALADEIQCYCGYPDCKYNRAAIALREMREVLADLIICAEQLRDRDGDIRPHASEAIAKARAALNPKSLSAADQGIQP